MTKYTRLLFGLFIAVALTLAVSCTTPPAQTSTAPTKAPAAGQPTSAPAAPAATSAPSASGQDIKIGVILPLSGDNAAGGQILKQAFDLAVKEINDAGGIKSLGGAKIKPIYSDDQNSPATGSKETERLITTENVAVMVGSFASSVTYPSTEVAERYKVPFLVPNSIADNITERGFKYTFRLERKASLWGQDQLNFLQWLNKNYGEPKGKPIKNIGLVYANSDQGKSQAVGWKKFAKDAGFNIVLDEAYPQTSADLTSVVLKMKEAKPDVVIFSSYASDAILLQKTMASQRADTLAYLGSSSGHSLPSFVQSVGDQANYFFDLTEWSPDLSVQATQDLSKRFKAAYGTELNGGGAFWYASAWVMADALQRAGSVDHEKIRDAFTKTHITSGPAMVIPWSPLEFDDQGQMQHTRMLVVQYQDKVRKTVYPDDVASTKPVFPQPTWADRQK